MIQLLAVQIAGYLVLIAAASGGAALVVRTWLRNRHGLTADEVRRLMASVEDIQHSIEDLRADGDGLRRQLEARVSEISGRVEFAERLLTKDDQLEN
jgi:hypothetical protein